MVKAITKVLWLKHILGVRVEKIAEALVEDLGASLPDFEDFAIGWGNRGLYWSAVYNVTKELEPKVLSSFLSNDPKDSAAMRAIHDVDLYFDLDTPERTGVNSLRLLVTSEILMRMYKILLKKDKGDITIHIVPDSRGLRYVAEPYGEGISVVPYFVKYDPDTGVFQRRRLSAEIVRNEVNRGFMTFDDDIRTSIITESFWEPRHKLLL